ncbi:MAG: SAP domain-containing protein [Euryarchaeota archaeon]|jgi:hypothetical protein|nr:SAP domain-containing protein [Euryarchaeota archaeon]
MSPTSSLTVAALKQLCKDKELAISGKKADLVSRLLKYGASEEELGIEVEETSGDTEIIEDEEGELILESEIVEEEEILEEEEVLEAEILEAEILEVELVGEDEEIPTLIETAMGARFSTPEVDWKKTAAVVASLLILGGGAWWWFSLEAQPFTPDPLRHGDEMGFAVTGGEMVATGEYASKVFEWFGSDDDVCKLNVDFSGKGSIEIKEGDSTDLSGEMGNDRLGAVKQRGGSGFSWLTMEKELQYDFDDVSISKSEQLKTVGCQEMPSVSARVGIDWTEWVEISGQNTLRSQFDYELTHPDGHLLGEVTSFGLGGVIDSLDALGMGASMTFAPLQVHDVLGNTLIDEDAAGNISGWSWRVTGSEDFGNEIAWKILFQNKDLEKHCLGHATIHVLVIPSSPWAVRQSTDLLISSEDSDNCGTLEEILGEYAMPEGRLELRMTVEKTSLSRGEHLVDLGLSYDSKPDFSALRPPSSEMQDWASNNQMHTPDNSTKRSHNLELAVSCIDVFNTPARDALRDYQAYIWRAQDNRSDSSKTTWNMSWLANDDSSGWIIIDVSGTTASSEACTLISEGMHDDAPSHNRKAIPESPSISWMETNRWLDGGLFPEFSGSDGLAAKNGQWHSDLKLGVLVATTGFDLPNSLNFLPVNDAGKTTIDGIRSWDEGDWSHTFTFAADATDGQILGWSHVWSSD